MDKDAEAAVSWRSLTLDLPPSCIEFCPAHPEFFVVGTYNLQKEDAPEDNGNEEEPTAITTISRTQNRNGSLVLFQLSANDVVLRQTVPYPSAILDLHFANGEGCKDVLSVVSSTGTLSFFKLHVTPPSTSTPSVISLSEIARHRPLGDDQSLLILSCAWHPTIHDVLAITTSQYEVHILRVEDKSFTVVSSMLPGPVITHTLEAWTVAFSPEVTFPSTSPDEAWLSIFSGGDDSKLLWAGYKCHEPHETQKETHNDDDDDATWSPNTPITFRGHEAGVTAILPLSSRGLCEFSIVVTGSYDDHLRVYKTYPQMGSMMSRRPDMVCSENMGGGVWRLKLIDHSFTAQGVKVLILASCMHAGCRVVMIQGNSDSESFHIKVLGRFEEHKSMNYGSDFMLTSGTSLRCVSTSFYDRLLCLWDIDVPRLEFV